jgi:hypothetical protein
MKKIVLIVVTIAILGVSLFTLTGCSITAETNDNSVSVSVDEETQGTFNNIVDWIVERLHRVFSTDSSTESSSGGSSDSI